MSKLRLWSTGSVLHNSISALLTHPQDLLDASQGSLGGEDLLHKCVSICYLHQHHYRGRTFPYQLINCDIFPNHSQTIACLWPIWEGNVCRDLIALERNINIDFWGAWLR